MVRFLLTLLLVAAGCTSQGTPYERMYVFGDSYSDTGAGYVDGNGPTAVAYFAERMGITLVPSHEGSPEGKSLNYAVSGAQTGSREGRKIKDALLGYGMQNQAADFAAQVRSGAIDFTPELTLFYIAGGLNDKHLETATTVDNLKSIIRGIYALGGRHFRIALMPTEIPSFSEVGTRLNPALQTIPTEIASELPDADVQLSNWGPAFDDVMRDPDNYGLTNSTDPCTIGRALFDQDVIPCATPETYFYYHPGHPSTAVHKIVGDRLYEEAVTQSP